MLDNVSKRHVFTHLPHLDSDPVTNVRLGNDHHISALNFRDSIALVSKILDFDFPLFTLFNRWAVVFLLWIFMIGGRDRVRLLCVTIIR